jgi:hypothetical protein
MMFIRRPIAQVMNAQLQRAAFLGALHHAGIERGAADVGEQRQNVDPHGGMVKRCSVKALKR